MNHTHSAEWSVTIEMRRLIYSPHAQESEARGTVNVQEQAYTHTHTHTSAEKNCRDYELEKVTANNKGRTMLPLSLISIAHTPSTLNARSHDIPTDQINAGKAFPVVQCGKAIFTLI